MTPLTERISHRLDLEKGTIYKHARRSVAVVYPSPYPVGMASLGFQTVYRRLNALSDVAAERAFLPDDDMDERSPLVTYESQRPVGDFEVIAFSVAYELEISGFFTCLQKAGLSPIRTERRATDPWVVVGGPLTFSNPVPLAPFADVIVLGEAEDVLAPLMDVLYSGLDRREALKQLVDIPGVYVPEIHGVDLPPIAQCRDSELPAHSAITTPDSALPNMFLVEPERGCSRGCTFCVMRRTTNGGMRWVQPTTVLSAIPEDATRVGLVGAAVTDHPGIVDIVRSVVDSGRGIGVSSMRADRLTPEFVELLSRGGYRTVTVASDGASERLRIALEKKIREKHLMRTAELVREFQIPKLKVYMMLGVPGETMGDLDELIDFGGRLKSVAGSRVRLSLGVATFVAKRNTPLDGAPFVGIRESDRRIQYVRKRLRGIVDVRPSSSRWAWVESMLSQGGEAEGLAALEAWRQGGKFAAWKKAFARAEANTEVSIGKGVDGKRALPILSDCA